MPIDASAALCSLSNCAFLVSSSKFIPSQQTPLCLSCSILTQLQSTLVQQIIPTSYYCSLLVHSQRYRYNGEKTTNEATCCTTSDTRPWPYHQSVLFTRHQVVDLQPVQGLFQALFKLQRHALEAKHRAYACPHDGCRSRFRRPSDLREHNKEKHSDANTLWACELCSKKYKREAALRRHVERKHQDDEDVVNEDASERVGLHPENVHASAWS